MTLDTVALRARALAATPGHWSVQGPWPHATIYAFDNPDLREDVEACHIASSPLILRSDQKCADDADMAFIAAANPQAVIALLDEIDRLRMELRDREIMVEDRGESFRRVTEELAAMTAARDEACESWQAHLTGAIKRCGNDGGISIRTGEPGCSPREGRWEVSAPLCGECGARPATCVGRYEDTPYAYGCDECCGHGCEDGVCFPLDEIPQRLEIGRTNWHEVADERDRLRATLAQPHMVWAAEQHSVGVDIAAEDAKMRPVYNFVVAHNLGSYRVRSSLSYVDRDLFDRLGLLVDAAIAKGQAAMPRVDDIPITLATACTCTPTAHGHRTDCPRYRV